MILKVLIQRLLLCKFLSRIIEGFITKTLKNPMLLSTLHLIVSLQMANEEVHVLTVDQKLSLLLL